MKNSISACLVVRNEQAIIRRCLESLVGAMDEIIIVHDGPCADDTIQIARQYTDKVFIQPFLANSDMHRPFSFRQATSEWILALDADEFLSDDLKKEIRGLAASQENDAYAFVWPIWNPSRNQYVTEGFPHKWALFRRSQMSYLGVPHQHPFTYGKIVYSKLILEHRPNYYNWSWPVFFTKHLRWARVHAHCLIKDFKDIAAFQVKETNWSKLILFKRRFPLVAMPLSFAQWILSLARQHPRGLIGWKYVLLWSTYQIALWYNVWKAKRGYNLLEKVSSKPENF